MAIKGFLTKNKDKNIVVVVPTDNLKIQWIQELATNSLIHDVTVEVINSAIKRFDKIDFLINDECHRYASSSFIALFSNRNPTFVLGLSATFSRLDGRHELLNQYCPVVDVITVKEAIANKWLSPYKEYKVIIEPNDIQIYKDLTRQFNESFSVFNFDFNLAMTSMTNIIKRRMYAKEIGMSAKDMDAVVFTWGRCLRARKDYVMNHPKKVELTRKIIEARSDKKIITFSATIKQAEKIGGGFLVHSGKTKKKNRISIEDFSKLGVGCIHTAKSLDEGSDIPGLNVGIILCNSSSSTQKTQRRGRIIRYEDGKESELFHLVLKDTNEESWFQTSTTGQNYIEINESELDDILNYKEIETLEKEAKETDLLFRF